MYSVIIPVYKNEEFVPELIIAFEEIHETIAKRFGISTEFVFVVDASPDNSFTVLSKRLPKARFPSQLVLHARNTGSFAAIRSGLVNARGDFIGIIAADLQEPPELLVRFLEPLSARECDIVVGTRSARNDPLFTRMSSWIFWSFYRRWIMRDMPNGGVDIFGCTRQVRDELVKLEEAHSSLVGLIYWIGFRRKEISYIRQSRRYGNSAWTFRRKLRYLLDSIFSFTDLPIQVLTFFGAFGTLLAGGFGLAVIILRILGAIEVPGYAALVNVIVFFGALNTLGLGLVGSYAWRAYENTKRRSLTVVSSFAQFEGTVPLPSVKRVFTTSSG